MKFKVVILIIETVKIFLLPPFFKALPGWRMYKCFFSFPQRSDSTGPHLHKHWQPGPTARWKHQLCQEVAAV